MAAEITITGNKLRLLCRQFLVIVPLNQMKVSQGSKFNCIVDRLGNVGIIECVHIMVMDLSAISEPVNNLCDGITEHKEYYRRMGYFSTAKMQLCYFRFVRRSDAQFAKLIDHECPQIGLNIHPQPSLFDHLQNIH